MYKKNQGYGICGSKNIYSSKVRLDNWVEDTIGMDLGHTERPPFKLYSTVTNETHCDPSLWPEPQKLPANTPTPLELKTKNKDGLPYALLFEHNSNVPTEVSDSIGIGNGKYLITLHLGTLSNRLNASNEQARSPNFPFTEIIAPEIEGYN